MKLLMVVSAWLLVGAVQAETAVIVSRGRCDYRIVTPDGKSPAVAYAAKELQGYLTQITGVRLPIVSEAVAGDGPAFLLGPCERNTKAGLVGEAARLREDGVLIKTLGNDIALLGQNERGNLYSVYVLLEKYLGVRFLAWDCTVVPKRAELTLPEIAYSYSPPFMYRETLYFNSFPKEIAARQRLNGPYTKCDASVGGKIEFYPYVHSFHVLIPPEEYFKDHPEYFGLQAGKRVAGDIFAQLCLTNPDVLRLAKEKVLNWIDKHPDIPIIDVSQNDGDGACECDKCMAVVNEEGSQHGPILRFVNAIADEVAKKHPDKWVETLAYAYSAKPPAITKPRGNVIIRLCHVGCYFHGFEQCGRGANLTGYISEWSKLTKRIFIWHYATNFGHYIAPNQNLEGLARDIKYYGSQGVNGVMVQCNYQGPGGELAELREYLSAQLMWDPTQDPMQIRTEFCNGYYGKASANVLEFLGLMDRISKAPDVHAFGAWDPQNTVSPQFVEDSLRILERARSASDSRAVRNRVEKLMLPFWYMQLTYSAKYGLSDKHAPSVWKQAKRVITDNKITHVSEASWATWAAATELRFKPLSKDVVLDLTRISPVKTVDCLSLQLGSVQKEGRSLPTIFQHPNAKGNADAIYELPLPKLPKGKKLIIKFGTVVTNKTQDGVRFSILVDGAELWSENKTIFVLSEQAAPKSAQDSILPSANPFSDHVLDLSAYAGRTISLILRVNALADNSYDWANWVEPRVVLAK
ncbi:MAG: DUF4838 domain-containing protein [Armatimonadetes bacterium]|nr:DUF4838 domain-containing protein [Armatimonadota bacterium]